MSPNVVDDTRNVIVFFGLGAVGATMLTCLAELAERDGTPVRFVVFARDPDSARDALFHAERYFENVDFVGLPAFDPVFALDPAYAPLLANAWFLVNAALPAFNRPMLVLAEALGVHAVDLASDMYGDETKRSLTFEQYEFDAGLRARGAAALINLGVSPGITNFLVGQRIHALRATGRRGLSIERIDLYLLEDIDSDELVFSWSPLVALEELAQQPRVIDGWAVWWCSSRSPCRARTRSSTRPIPRACIRCTRRSCCRSAARSRRSRPSRCGRAAPRSSWSSRSSS
jgi:saccharopine dehydrogenase (NAD+, L-lysine-forming)